MEPDTQPDRPPIVAVENIDMSLYAVEYMGWDAKFGEWPSVRHRVVAVLPLEGQGERILLHSELGRFHLDFEDAADCQAGDWVLLRMMGSEGDMEDNEVIRLHPPSVMRSRIATLADYLEALQPGVRAYVDRQGFGPSASEMSVVWDPEQCRVGIAARVVLPDASVLSVEIEASIGVEIETEYLDVAAVATLERVDDGSHMRVAELRAWLRTDADHLANQVRGMVAKETGVSLFETDEFEAWTASEEEIPDGLRYAALLQGLERLDLAEIGLADAVQ